MVSRSSRKTSQRRASDDHRQRLTARGMVCIEVVGPDADRELTRSDARHLTEGNAETERLSRNFEGIDVINPIRD